MSSKVMAENERPKGTKAGLLSRRKK